MSDPNFAALRSVVEQQTLLPEFEVVAVRGRRRRRRHRLTTVLWSLGALVVCLPGLAYIGALLGSASDRPGIVQISVAGGGNDDAGTTTTITLPAPSQPVTMRLVAAGGVDLAHAYGLIDACRARICNLQLVSLRTDAATERIGLLRSDPFEAIANARVIALDDSDVVVTAEVGNSIGPESQTLNLGSIFATKKVSVSAEPVQTTTYGKIEVVRGSDGVIRPITRQPTLASAILATASHGWWVIGNDPQTGELAVSVSHDAGASWRTTALGVMSESDRPPALATADGSDVYVLAHSGGQMLLIRSTDGGATWRSPIPENAWNGFRQFGVITPADGSVAVWLANGSGTVSYRRSIDHGASFAPVVGANAPSGEVVALSDGYVALGANPAISTDGRTWRTIKIPYVPPS